MTAVISPPMFLQFFNPLGLGFLAGGKLFTYLSGTSTKTNTWTDSTQSVLNSNPIILDSQGACYVWLDPTITYKFVLAPSSDTDPPVSAYRTVDNIAAGLTSAVLTQAFLGSILYPRTAAEIAKSVTPTAYQYAPGDLRRYGGGPGFSLALNNTAWAAAALIADTHAIYVCAGIWDYGDAVTQVMPWFKTNNVHVYGDGIDKTVLRPVGWNDGLRFSDANYPAVLTRLTGITVNDLTIDGVNMTVGGGNDTNGNGINDMACDYVVIERVKVSNVLYQGIVSTYYVFGGVRQKSRIVTECTVEGCLVNRQSIGIEGASENNIITNNVIRNTAGDGIQCSYNGGAFLTNGAHIIAGNRIDGPTGGTARGINVGDFVYKVDITDNLITGLDISIRTSSIAASTYDYKIQDNRCYEWTSGGIFAFPMNGADDSLAYIAGNKIKSSVASGASIGIYAAKGAHVGTNDIASATVGVQVATGATGVIIDQQFNTCATKINDLGTGTVIYGDVVTYTPTWTSSGTQPALGNGSLSGRYVRNGNIVTAEIALAMGSTTTFGTGTYLFSLPFVIGTLTYAVGAAQITDTGVNEYTAVARADNTNGIRLFVTTSPAAAVTNLVPFTFGNTDQILITISYPV